MAKKKTFMMLAAKEAVLGVRLGHGGPFGAVMVRKGKIVAKAHNLVNKSKDPTAHAEITAIRRACSKLKRHDLSDCELYSSCEPCPMCLSAIHWARIKRFYFGCTRYDAAKAGFDDKLLYDMFSGKKTRKNKKTKPRIKSEKLGRKECLKAFDAWNKKKDRRGY